MPSIEEVSDEIANSFLAQRPAIQKSQDELMNDFNSTPLFMTDAPTDEQIKENPTLSAIQSLIYDSKPEEIATNFKNHGNEAFGEKTTPGYRTAVEYYTKGLDQKFDDAKLRSLLHSNRAAAHLELGNYRKATQDCLSSLEYDSANIKAYFRLGRAYLTVDKVEEALKCIYKGLLLQPSNKALTILKEQVEARKSVLERKSQEVTRRDYLKKSEHEALLAKIKERNVKVLGDLSQGPHSVKIDAESNALVWPVLLLYPEFKQSDLISNFNELDTFKDQIHNVLAEGLPWDTSSDYRPDSVELYFETDAVPPRLVKFQPSMSLLKVLSHPKLVVKNGIPNIIMIAKGTKFRDDWLKLYTR